MTPRESAYAAPDERRRRRLHRLGDVVTAQAAAIDGRADRVPDGG